MKLTDQQALQFMEIYNIPQAEVARRVGVSRGTMNLTINRMKNSDYIYPKRGAVDRAKAAIVEILEEKGVILK